MSTAFCPSLTQCSLTLPHQLSDKRDGTGWGRRKEHKQRPSETPPNPQIISQVFLLRKQVFLSQHTQVILCLQGTHKRRIHMSALPTPTPRRPRILSNNVSSISQHTRRAPVPYCFGVRVGGGLLSKQPQQCNQNTVPESNIKNTFAFSPTSRLQEAKIHLDTTPALKFSGPECGVETGPGEGAGAGSGAPAAGGTRTSR